MLLQKSTLKHLKMARTTIVSMIIYWLLTWAVQPRECTHPCSTNAVLKYYGSVSLTTEIRQSILFDYGDFVNILDKIQVSVEPFVKEISDYSTMSQLDELAVADLEPFNNRVNLVPISNETIADMFIACKKIGASLFGFEDKTEIALMTELMNKKGIKSIMFAAFIANTGILGFGSQKLLFDIPSKDVQAEWTDANIANVKVLWFNSDGKLGLNNTGSGFGYCQKPASPFQSVHFENFEGRTWLGLVSRSVGLLNTFDRLYSEFKNNMNSIRTKIYSEDSVVGLQRVMWTSPESFLRAHEFISHYDYDKTWDESTGSVLYELSQFVRDIEEINNVLNDEVIISLRKMTITPKRAIKTKIGLVATRIDVNDRLTGGTSMALFQGDMIGKSTDDATRATIYRGYAHMVTPGEKASNAFILASGSTYRAVENYEEFSFDCVESYCSQHSGGRQKSELECGAFFMGIKNNPEGCKMESVTEPIAYSAYCSLEGEVISSFSEPYTLSLWCNGHMSEMIKLDPGVNEIRSDCEVRSADGRTQFSTQHGQVLSRKAVVVKLRSVGDTKILENLKKIGADPVYGAILGLSLILIFVIVILIINCIGLKKFISMMRCRRSHTENYDIPLREMQPLRPARQSAPIVFNLSPVNRGEIVPKTLRRYRN